MGRQRRQRRQPHGSAWHWKQTDCWYYTLPGTKKRMPLFDEQGQRVRGVANAETAELALAQVKLAGDAGLPAGGNGQWQVARVCSDYLQYCERGVANGTISQGHRDNAKYFLNDLCGYCGALPVSQLKKRDVQTWLEEHAGWRSKATQRGVLAIVLAAFNRATAMHDVPNPLKGLKKPVGQPRLASFSQEDEQALNQATEPCFQNFLLAAIHTGLRPFCELARLTADDVEETPRGLMWRVYSSKTKKTRKIPVQSKVVALTRQLMKTAPRGSGLPLFRNTKGQPWKRMTGVVRFLTIKRKLRWDQDPIRSKYSCYTCRHTFAHRMLSGYWTNGVGCSIETLAELIGDTPKVAFDHYGKEWGQHYQDPLWTAIGVGPAANGHAPRKPSRRGKSQRPTATVAAKQRRRSGKSRTTKPR